MLQKRSWKLNFSALHFRIITFSHHKSSRRESCVWSWVVEVILYHIRREWRLSTSHVWKQHYDGFSLFPPLRFIFQRRKSNVKFIGAQQTARVRKRKVSFHPSMIEKSIAASRALSSYAALTFNHLVMFNLMEKLIRKLLSPPSPWST